MNYVGINIGATAVRRVIWFLLLSLCLVLSASAAIDTENLLGRYERDAPTNDWHRGNLTRHPTDPSKLRWTNDAGVFWTLTPDVANGVLITGADFPYAQSSPNMPMQSLGVVGASAVASFQINGEAYSRRFTILNAYANKTTNCNYIIRGPFIVWWEFGNNFQAHATALLANAERIRNQCWAFGMRDPSIVYARHYQNIYLNTEANTFSWPTGNGVGGDSNGYTLMTTPGWYNDSSNHEHEVFHLYQFNMTSPGFQYSADTSWFFETSATWFQAINSPSFPFVMSALIPANPHLPLWRGLQHNNGEPGDPVNANREGRPYGMSAFLHFLTAAKGVPQILIAGGYYAGTTQNPQQYLYNQIGPANFRQYFTEWTAHNAAYQDYLTRAQWADAKDWLNTYGDPADVAPYIQTYTDSGTSGVWVSPPANLAPRSWASNVFRVIISSAAPYTLHLNGNATGTSGAAAVFSGTAVVMDVAGNQFHPFVMNTSTQGTVTVSVPATATEMFFVINAIPAQFTGNQSYPYQVRIDRGYAPTITDIANRTINEDTNTGALAFTIGDVDTALASLTVTGSSSNLALIPNANIVFGGSGANRTVTVTPAPNMNGTATITLTVSDGTLTASSSFLLTVTAVNDAPTITNMANRSINEDTNTGAIAFSIGDAETAATSLVVTRASSNLALVPLANVVLAGTGASRTVTITPAADLSGTATITVTVSDGVLTATDTFLLTVTAVNDTPTITDIANRTIDEDTNTGAVAFTIGDVDTALATLTVSGSSSDVTLVPNASIVFGGAGAARTVTVTPAADQNGSATITVSVSDGSTSGTDTFLLTVAGVNDAPTISDVPNQSINENTSTAALGFTIGDLETVPALLVVTGSSSNPALVPNANIVFGGSGANRTVTVTPAANRLGSATITVTVSDGTLTASDTFVVTTTGTALETWRFANFGTTANTGNAADLADPNNDSEKNLLEYATAQSPTANSRIVLSAARTSSAVEMTYTRSKAALTGGVTFSVEWSDTLATNSWSATGVTQSILTDNGTMQTVKATIPTGSTIPVRFARLKVTSP